MDALRVGHVSLVEGALWVVWVNYWWYAARGGSGDIYAEPARQQLLRNGLLGVAFVLLFAQLPGSAPNDQVLTPGGTAAGLAGIVLTVLGLGFSVWARRHLANYWSGRIALKEGHRLVQSGPYGWVRHPIYTGVLIAIVGRAISMNTGATWIGAVLAAGVYLSKVLGEERVLMQHFGEEYARYRADVKALVPGLW
jgi:protein-S-isoprenylcysteine O-methyltransferase Ste14